MAYFYVGAARLAVPALFGWLLMQACAETSSSNDATGGAGAGGSTSSGGTHVIKPGAAGEAGAAGAGGAGGASELNPLCAVQLDGCVPDDAESCASYGAPQALLSLAGGSGGDGGAGGVSGGGGGGGGEAGTAGAGGAGGSAGGGASGTGGLVEPPDTAGAGAGGGPAPEYACRVAQGNDGVRSDCGATGGGALDAPCFTGSDCSAGLGCAVLGSVARCRPYCCAGDSACVVPGTYCAERPLSDDSLISSIGAVTIPVCVPADNCDLAELPPCAPGKKCQCPADTACTVVRPNGTTACVAEGSGQLGEPCPCRAGFVCSRASDAGTCVQLCATEGSSDPALTCASGRCQASAELPRGFGVCVGVGSEKP